MRFCLKQVHDQIFLLTFDHHYDVAIHFLRAQEYYESNDDKFKGSQFKMLDYIEHYAKSNDLRFSYADDFVGFNVPGEVLDHIYGDDSYIFSNEINGDSRNKYDDLMLNVVRTIHSIVGRGQKYYLIGAKEGDEDTIDHELAHAFWYVSDDYKSEQMANIESCGDKLRKKVLDCLVESKYSMDVVDDEHQAYFSTGLDGELEEIVGKRNVKKVTKPFTDTFKKWKKEILK